MAEHAEITFGMRSDQLDPESVTACLGIEPTNSFAKGDSYISKSTGQQKRPWGVWQLSSHRYSRSVSLEDHACALLEQLEPLRDRVEAFMDIEGYYVDIRIWWEVDAPVGSFTLPSGILQRLSKICKEFNFSVICASDGELSKL